MATLSAKQRRVLACVGRRPTATTVLASMPTHPTGMGVGIPSRPRPMRINPSPEYALSERVLVNPDYFAVPDNHVPVRYEPPVTYAIEPAPEGDF